MSAFKLAMSCSLHCSYRHTNIYIHTTHTCVQRLATHNTTTTTTTTTKGLCPGKLRWASSNHLCSSL